MSGCNNLGGVPGVHGFLGGGCAALDVCRHLAQDFGSELGRDEEAALIINAAKAGLLSPEILRMAILASTMPAEGI